METKKKSVEQKMIDEYGLTLKIDAIEDKDGQEVSKREYGLPEKSWKILPSNLKLWCVTNKITVFTGDEDFLVPVSIYKFLEMKDYTFLSKYRMILKDIEDEFTAGRVDFSSRSGISRLFTDEFEVSEVEKEYEKVKNTARGASLNWGDDDKEEEIEEVTGEPI